MNGVDVSEYQGQIDWATLKDHIGFAIVKVTEGAHYLDPEFGANRQGMRDVNLPCRGYYHFARFDSKNPSTGYQYNNTPEEEAQWFVNMIGTNLQAGEILVLDYEVHSSDPTGHCKRFLDAVYNATGVRPLLYSYISLLSTINPFGPYAVWIAAPSYSVAKDSVPSRYAYVMQQYGQGNVAGVSGAVDLDHFFGDEEDFKSYGLPSPVVTPPPVVVPPVIISPPTPTPGTNIDGVIPPVTKPVVIPTPPVIISPVPVTTTKEHILDVLTRTGKTVAAVFAGLQILGVNGELQAQATTVIGALTALWNTLLHLRDALKR